MNDFTREELEELVFWENGLDSYYCAMGYGEGYSSEDNQLLNKIKAMIDSYCDHDRQYGCIDCTACWCKKCGKTISIINDVFIEK